MALWQYQQRAAPPPGAPTSAPAAALDWFQPASVPAQHFKPKPRQPGYAVSAVLEVTLVTTPTPPLQWFQPASVPVRRPLPRQQGVAACITEPTLFVAPNPQLTWLPKADPLPIRVRPRPHGGATTPPLPYVPPPNFWTPKQAERHFPARPRQPGWWCGILEDFVVLDPPNPWSYLQPEIPVKRRAQRPMGGTTEPLGSIPPSSSWYQPASEPTRRSRPRLPGLWTGVLELNVIAPDVPHPLPEVPVRRVRHPLGGTVQPMLPTDVAAEMDWYCSTTYRTPAEHLPNTSQLVQPLLPSDVAAELDWHPVPGQPLRVVPRPAGGTAAPVFTPLPDVPLTQEQPTPRRATWVGPACTGTVEPTLVLTPPVLSWQGVSGLPSRRVSLPYATVVLPLLPTEASEPARYVTWRVPARPVRWVTDRELCWRLPRRNVTWKANVMPVLQTYEKYVDEERQYAIDFADMPEIADSGETLSTLTSFAVESGSGLTVASTSISGTKAVATLSAGTNGTTYQLRAVVVTSSGKTLVGEGMLKVVD